MIGPGLLLFGSLFAVCSLIFLAGNKAKHPKVGSVLKQSALIWGAILAAVYGFMFLAIGTCTGDMLYGYVECRIIPSTLADASLMLFVFGTLGGLAYGAALVLICGVLEWRYRRG